MTAVPDMQLSDVEIDVAATVREVVASLNPRATAAAALYDGDTVPARELWDALRERLGAHLVLLPEESGGLGLGARAAAAVARELGRGLAPVPFLTSSVVATTLALDLDAQAVVARLAAGDTIVLAHPADLVAPSVSVTVDSGGRLDGQVRAVPDADRADALLVPADGPDGTVLVLVETSDVAVSSTTALDMSRRFSDIDVTGAAGAVVGRDVMPALVRSLEVGSVALAAEQEGLADWCFTTAREHLTTRRQFGRLLGSFQALKHRMADLWILRDAMTTVSRHGAGVLESEDRAESTLAAALAQATASDAAVEVAETVLQLHGGLGMTWEHPVHLYLKRAKSDQVLWGTAEQHRASLAPLVGIEA